MNLYVLMVPSLSGRPVLPSQLGFLEAPIVVIHPDTLAMYTPVRWVALRGRLQ